MNRPLDQKIEAPDQQEKSHLWLLSQCPPPNEMNTNEKQTNCFKREEFISALLLNHHETGHND